MHYHVVIRVLTDFQPHWAIPSRIAFRDCTDLSKDCFFSTSVQNQNFVFSACGPCYELKAYPQHKVLNSRVVEQSNAGLQRIKGQISCMTKKIHEAL